MKATSGIKPEQQSNSIPFLARSFYQTKNKPGWISLVATMESFLPWKTTVQLGEQEWLRRLATKYIPVPKCSGVEVLKKKMKDFLNINFCWNIFLLANFRHWVIFIATICHNHKHYLFFIFGPTLQRSLQILFYPKETKILFIKYGEHW